MEYIENTFWLLFLISGIVMVLSGILFPLEITFIVLHIFILMGLILVLILPLKAQSREH